MGKMSVIGGKEFMREIKFRAWLTLSDYDDDGNDKDYHGMANKISVHHDGAIGFHVDEGRNIFGADVFERAMENDTLYEYEEWCYWEGQCNLMQYTGLKDKNGVEIYEGDVVKETIRSDMGESEQERFWPITWGDEFAGFNVGEAPHWSVLNPVDIKRMEVAGNIYENPELLESK